MRNDESGSIEIAAAPVRYPVAPVLALVFIALVPLVALSALYRSADRRADEYEAARADEVVDERTIDPIDPASTARRLGTPLFAVRRTPAPLLRQSNVGELREQVEPLLGFLDDRSCAVVSVDGTVIASANESAAVIPASLAKLATAAVALEVVGPETRFVTRLAAESPVDGVIDGDVFLIGGGDPTLVSDDANDGAAFVTTSIDPLADALVALGVTRVRGRIVVDDGRYDGEWTVDSWAAGSFGTDVGPIGAMVINDGRILGRRDRQIDPADASAREFVRLLGNRGIRVDGGVARGPADPAVAVVGEVRSAPTADLVADMLLRSDNDTAEMLLKEIGLVAQGEGTRVAGLNAVDVTLRSWGVPAEGLRLLDGSGLSPTNRMTCTAVISLLQRLRGTQVAEALPVAARSGTLADDFLESPMAGRLVAKTGTLENLPTDADPPAVKALAGFVPLDDGATIVFALILNTPDANRRETYGPLWDAFGKRFATYPAGRDVTPFGPGDP